MLTKALIVVGLLGGASILHAQAIPTATRVGDLKIGGGFTTANSDYGSRFNGGAGYFNFDFTNHFGVEGQFHFVQGGGTDDLYEKTYEVGGRYFRTYGKWVPYAKLSYGRGVFNFPPYVPGGPHPNLAYNLFAIGGGADYKLRPHIYLRGDFEYQEWLSFVGSSLTPSLITIGAAYHF